MSFYPPSPQLLYLSGSHSTFKECSVFHLPLQNGLWPSPTTLPLSDYSLLCLLVTTTTHETPSLSRRYLVEYESWLKLMRWPLLYNFQLNPKGMPTGTVRIWLHYGSKNHTVVAPSMLPNPLCFSGMLLEKYILSGKLPTLCLERRLMKVLVTHLSSFLVFGKYGSKGCTMWNQMKLVSSWQSNLSDFSYHFFFLGELAHQTEHQVSWLPSVHFHLNYLFASAGHESPSFILSPAFSRSSWKAMGPPS